MTPRLVQGTSTLETPATREESIELVGSHPINRNSEFDDSNHCCDSMGFSAVAVIDSSEDDHDSSTESMKEKNHDDLSALFRQEQQHHEWYLPAVFCREYEIPVLFEDGMDFIECELYYAAHEQGSGGFVSKKGYTKSQRTMICRTKPRSVSCRPIKNSNDEGDHKQLLPSCLRRSSWCHSSTLDVSSSTITQPWREEEGEVSPWLYSSPGMRRCSFAGLITTSTANTLIASPTPKKHRSPRERFFNSNFSVVPLDDTTLDSSSFDDKRNHEHHVEQGVHNRCDDFPGLVPSSPTSSTQPSELPPSRSSMLDWHHRKSKSQSELSDMMDPFVTFSPMVQVVTIPAAWDYPLEMRRDLWLTRKELKEFLRQATSEKRRRRRRQLLEVSNDETITIMETQRNKSNDRNQRQGHMKKQQPEEKELEYNDNECGGSCTKKGFSK